MSLTAKLLVATWVIIFIAGAFGAGYYLGGKKNSKDGFPTTSPSISSSGSSLNNPIPNSTPGELNSSTPVPGGTAGNNVVSSNEGKKLFEALTDEQKKCLKDKLGEEKLGNLISGQLIPGVEEQKIIEDCGVEMPGPGTGSATGTDSAPAQQVAPGN